MTSRSTRNKLRWQVEKVMQHLEKCQKHLMFLDEMAAGESEYINTYVPTLTALIEEMIKTASAFRTGL